jgi:hypothetical protein
MTKSDVVLVKIVLGVLMNIKMEDVCQINITIEKIALIVSQISQKIKNGENKNILLM